MMARVHIPVMLPSDLLEALGEHTGIFWSHPDMGAVIGDAIRSWIKPVPAAAQQPAAPSAAGYQWKQVFLPEGTVLRASFGGTPSFAVVEGAGIKYGERAVSPSGFANLQGSGNRNAWKAVWLRFPGSAEWLRADVCRAARQAAIARMFGPDTHEAGSAPPAASHQRRDADRQSTRRDTVPAAHLDRRQDQRQRRKPPRHNDQPSMAREQPSRREAAAARSRVDASEVDVRSRQPVAQQSAPRQPGPGPSASPPASQSNAVERKKGHRRGGRRKNHTAQHFPGNP